MGIYNVPTLFPVTAKMHCITQYTLNCYSYSKFEN